MEIAGGSVQTQDEARPVVCKGSSNGGGGDGIGHWINLCGDQVGAVASSINRAIVRPGAETGAATLIGPSAE